MADVLGVFTSAVLNGIRAIRVALGFVALWKAIDLALRLPRSMDGASGALVILVWITGAALLVLNRHVHLAGAALAVAGSLALLVGDLYNHHLYLFIVVALVLALYDEMSQVTLLRAQLTIVYAFAVLTKINGTFLSGDVVRASLERSTLFGSVSSDGLTVGVAHATILIELGLPIALWWTPRTRRAALVVGLAFHIGVVLGTAHDLESFVQLTTFGALMVSLYLAFFVDPPAPPVDVGSGRSTSRVAGG